MYLYLSLFGGSSETQFISLVVHLQVLPPLPRCANRGLMYLATVCVLLLHARPWAGGGGAGRHVTPLSSERQAAKWGSVSKDGVLEGEGSWGRNWGRSGARCDIGANRTVTDRDWAHRHGAALAVRDVSELEC